MLLYRYMSSMSAVRIATKIDRNEHHGYMALLNCLLSSHYESYISALIQIPASRRNRG